MSIESRVEAAGRLLGSALPFCAFSNEPDVVVAASKAGAIGFLGATRVWPDDIARSLARFEEELEGRPYGINLVFAHNMPEEEDRAVLESRIPEEHRRFISDLRTRYAVPKASLRPASSHEPIR